jgi:hypothetical protein
VIVKLKGMPLEWCSLDAMFALIHCHEVIIIILLIVPEDLCEWSAVLGIDRLKLCQKNIIGSFPLLANAVKHGESILHLGAEKFSLVLLIKFKKCDVKILVVEFNPKYPVQNLNTPVYGSNPHCLIPSYQFHAQVQVCTIDSTQIMLHVAGWIKHNKQLLPQAKISIIIHSTKYSILAHIL